MRKNFWKTIPLKDLSSEEWELLCDGCGKCCLNKFKKTKKSAPVYTSVACKFLNIRKCSCKVYSERETKRKDCLVLSPKNINKLVNLLPTSCSYRLINEKKPLPYWHHLNIPKNKNVHNTQNSVKNFAISEEYVDSSDILNFIFEKSNKN